MRTVTLAAIAASTLSLAGLQPVVKVWLHSGPPTPLPRWGPRSTGDASPGAALLLLQIQAVFSVVAPCPRGASPVSVRRQTFTTGCLDHPKRRPRYWRRSSRTLMMK